MERRGEGLSRPAVQCKPRPVGEIERTKGIESSELAKHVANAHTGKWGGVGGIEWKENGDLVTPWGKALGVLFAQMVKNCSWIGTHARVNGKN